MNGFRTDLQDYFGVYQAGSYNGSLTAQVRTPYIALLPDGPQGLLYPRDLFPLPADTVVLHAWPGQYRTDVFQMTARDLQMHFRDRQKQ